MVWQRHHADVTSTEECHAEGDQRSTGSNTVARRQHADLCTAFKIVTGTLDPTVNPLLKREIGGSFDGINQKRLQRLATRILEGFKGITFEWSVQKLSRPRNSESSLVNCFFPLAYSCISTLDPHCAGIYLKLLPLPRFAYQRPKHCFAPLPIGLGRIPFKISRGAPDSERVEEL